jgi:NADPH-dependent glutamate synthase beta subunit-like oxidoreductase
MRKFDHVNAVSFEEASLELASGASEAIAGGTDLLPALRTFINPAKYPEKIVNLKSIPDSAGISVDGDQVVVGALAKLSAIESSDIINSYAPALAEAANSVATPLVRNLGTIGGNICQDVRCWFYRYPEQAGDALICARKGGDECYAIRGENRYHSIFGGMCVGGSACAHKCPGGTDIPGYIERLRQNDVQGAADILIKYNPMSAITARVCAHPCQSACNRTHVPSNWKKEDADDSVSIHCLERYLGDYTYEHADRYYAQPESKTGKKAAIVGSGPAGLSAAYYLRRAGHDVTVIDSMEKAGGMLMYAIPHYRLPKKYVEKLIDLYKGMGIKFELGVKVGQDIEAEALEKKYDKVFYATGAWKRPVLGFDGEEFTEFGLEFLMEVNQWLNKKARKNVLVVGGGNVAMDVAVTAHRLGAESVTLACLESIDEMPASPEEIERAREEGINIMPSYGVSKVIYYGTNKVDGMELVRCTSVFDENHRFDPKYDSNEKLIVKADSILMAAGQRVDLSFLKKEYDIAVERGMIKVDETTQATSRKDVYAGGDVVTGPSTVIAAVGAGRNAADSINAEYGKPTDYGKKTGFLTLDPECLNIKRGLTDPGRSAEERSLDKEDTDTVTAKEVFEEARRCMNCSCHSVNASDISPVLIALDADIVTTKKIIKAADFFTTEADVKDMLEPGELVREIRFAKKPGYGMAYKKFRVRKSIDFAIVSMAAIWKKNNLKMEDIVVVLGGVAPVPVRASELEECLKGKELTADVIEAAAERAVSGAVPLSHNKYKLQEVKALTKALLKSI